MRAPARGRLWAWLVAVGALVAIAYAVRAPLLERAGRFLVLEEPPAAADAIVVLAGSLPDRILEAVALFNDGFAPRIILCREPESQAWARLRARGVRVLSGYETNRDIALQLGVPAAAIEIVDRPAGSTFGEAEVALHYAGQHGYRSILLVTSKMHTRRAAAIYRHLAGDSVRIIARPAREDGYRPDAWWHSRVDTRRVIIEYQKLLVFNLIDRWRVRPIDIPAPQRTAP